MRIRFFTLIILNLFFVVSQGLSQTNQKESDWKLYTEINGVQFYTKTVDCNDVQNGIYKELVLIKITNTTAYKFEVKWKNELWYDNKCVTCNSNSKEYKNSLVLEEDQTKEGDCINLSERGLNLFSKFLNYNDQSKLTKYNLVDIVVNPL
jgi:hypothetical protein